MVGRDLAAAAKLLGTEMERRGSHATGVCTVNARGHVKVKKAPARAEVFFASREGLGRSAQLLLVHTRHATQGPPAVNANNHPIESGRIVGIHNGVIWNDDSLWKANPTWVRRAEVDSEVVFAGLDVHQDTEHRLSVLEVTDGSMAVAWIDRLDPLRLHLARGQSSPLFTAYVKETGSLIFASTQSAVTDAGKALGLELTVPLMFKEGDYLSDDGAFGYKNESFKTGGTTKKNDPSQMGTTPSGGVKGATDLSGFYGTDPWDDDMVWAKVGEHHWGWRKKDEKKKVVVTTSYARASFAPGDYVKYGTGARVFRGVVRAVDDKEREAAVDWEPSTIDWFLLDKIAQIKPPEPPGPGLVWDEDLTAWVGESTSPVDAAT